MTAAELIEPVYSGKIRMLYRAAQLLDEHGIRSRHSQPEKARGILRVARNDAERARRLLPQLDLDGIISAAEAVFFFCPTCDATLSRGQNYCPECGEFVGDAHAM